MSEGAAIAAEGLRHRYPDGTLGLDGLCLRVERGERLALIGPNGAGKTTFLLHLNGLLEGEGKLEVLGLPVEPGNYHVLRGQAGMVFQQPDDQLFCPRILDDVAFGPINSGVAVDEAEARSREVLAQVGLEHAAGKCAFHLSAGEKKRAAIATVLVMQPALMVLDEPTSGLDPKGRKVIAALLAEIGGTQIVATHDFQFARQHCSRAAIVHDGKIVADGTPEGLLDDEALLRRYDLA